MWGRAWATDLFWTLSWQSLYLHYGCRTKSQANHTRKPVVFYGILWALYGYYMGVYGHYMGIIWVLYCIIWALYGYYMGIIWALYGYYMGNIWVLYGIIMYYIIWYYHITSKNAEKTRPAAWPKHASPKHWSVTTVQTPVPGTKASGFRRGGGFSSKGWAGDLSWAPPEISASVISIG